MKLPCSGLFLLGGVYRFNLLIGNLADFLFFHDSVLVCRMFLGTLPFLLNCQIYWHIIFKSSLMTICYSMVSIIIFPVSFMTLFGSSLIFWVSLSKDLTIVSLQRTSSSIFPIFFFSVYFIHFSSDLCYFSSSNWATFVFFLFGYKVRLFFFSQCRHLLLWTSFSELLLLHTISFEILCFYYHFVSRYLFYYFFDTLAVQQHVI